MKRGTLFWIAAIAITIASALFQRLSGPTHPLRGKAELGGEIISYRLHRSHSGSDDHEVGIDDVPATVQGKLIYRRHNTADEWVERKMNAADGRLRAFLPGQPPAGKLDYYVQLMKDGEGVRVPPGNAAVIRFKGEVPPVCLLPHIILMFAGMLLAVRSGLEAVNPGSRLRAYVCWTFILLLLGGMILGPIVQHYAFGAYWTGFPFGHDLTDNKTLVAMIGWTVALVAVRRSGRGRYFVIAAALLLLIVYMIPHSMLGSELDYSILEETGQGTLE